MVNAGKNLHRLWRKYNVTPSLCRNAGLSQDPDGHPLGYQHTYPPSTSTIEPVIRLAASLARNRTAEATSSTSPMRAIGVPPIQALYISGFDFTKALSGVLM